MCRWSASFALHRAREGPDVLIAFLNETEESNEVKKLVEKDGRKAVLVPRDLQDAKHCREVFGRRRPCVRARSPRSLGGAARLNATAAPGARRFDSGASRCCNLRSPKTFIIGEFASAIEGWPDLEAMWSAN